MGNAKIEETGFGRNESKMSLGNQISGSMKSIASRISSISNSSVTSIYGIVQKKAQSVEGLEEREEDAHKDGSEDENMRYLFSHLQAFSACLDAFAHGGNDVGYESLN